MRCILRLPHATLSWLGAVAGNTIVPLGLDRFSQSGDIPISAYGIDSDAILDMAARACLNAMREAPSRISISQATYAPRRASADDVARFDRPQTSGSGRPCRRRYGAACTPANGGAEIAKPSPGARLFRDKEVAVKSYAALPRVRVLGRPMGSSVFIFASAASMIPICELWRRSKSRRTEFSGTPSSLASLVLDQPRLRIVS